MSSNNTSSNSAGDPIDPIYWNNNTIWNNSGILNIGSSISTPITWTHPASWNTGYITTGYTDTINPSIEINGEWITKNEATDLINIGKKAKNEENLREDCPALQSIWEEYQTMLALVKETETNEF